MSVIGIDFGSSACVIATVQRGAISIIRNDLSERLTPSLVAFKNKERYIGEAAQTHMKSNYKNTCRYFKQLMGLTSTDKELISYEQQFALAPIDISSELQANSVGYRVFYKGEEQIFTASQCLAALLTSLKIMAEKATGAPVLNMVISVPAWYNDCARQAVLDATQMAGLHCLRAMNEHTAIALDYGIYRSNTFDGTNPITVAFVGVGHGSAFVSVVNFIRGELKILTCNTDRSLGGREIDMVIVKHFARIFEKQYSINPLNNTKARLKLEDAATKLKKVLSANIEAPYNIECVVEDYELTGILTRQDFEQICLPLKDRLLQLLGSTFQNSGINSENIHHLEIVGGCCRTPWIQATISEFFNNRLALSRTLSMDETVARGCALQAAMLDPRYRVREFNIIDSLLEPIDVCYATIASVTPGSAPEYKTGVLFEKGSALGSKKYLTFTRSANFGLQLICGKQGPTQTILIDLPSEGLDNQWGKRVKVCVKLTSHGTVVCESAQLLVDEEVLEEQPVQEQATAATSQKPVQPQASQQPETATGDVTGQVPQNENSTSRSNETEKQETTQQQQPASKQETVLKKKIKTRKFPCHVTVEPRLGYLNSEQIQTLYKAEIDMHNDDLQEQQLREIMNDLESYIYKMRGLLSEDLKKFATEEELQQALLSLQAAENWIYDSTSETTTKDEYEGQLKTLQQLCGPITNREQEYCAIQEAFQDMCQAFNSLRQTTTPESLQTQWSHIPAERISSLMTKLQETEQWLNHISDVIRSTPLNRDSTINSALIKSEKEMMIRFAQSILVSKPSEPPARTDKSPLSSQDEKGTDDNQRNNGFSTQNTDLIDDPMISTKNEQANFDGNNVVSDNGIPSARTPDVQMS